MKNLAATILLLLSTAAAAWPVDVYVDVKPGEEKFQKAAGTEWVEVQDPSLATVEVLPGDEVLITGKKAGSTLVMLYGEGRMGVWRLRVSEGTPDAVTANVPSSSVCQGLTRNPASPTDKLVTTIRTDPCRKALLELFKSDAFHSREVTLTYDIPVLQSQLRDVQSAIDGALGPKKVEAVYAGGSLRLKGNITRAEQTKVFWAVFNQSVGRVTLDDRLVLTDKPAADAGIAKSP